MDRMSHGRVEIADGMQITWDVQVPLRDGAMTYVDILRPQQAEGPFYYGSGTTTARIQTCFYYLRRGPTTCRSSNKTPTYWSCLHPLSIEEVKGGYLPLPLWPDQSACG